MEFKLESMPIIKNAISIIQSVLNTKPFSKASLAETHKLLIVLPTHGMPSATRGKGIQYHETCQCVE